MNEMCISDTTYGYNGDGTPPDKIVFVNDDGHTTYVPERTTTRNGKQRSCYGRYVPLCEVCGYAIGDKRYNFCPSCGARIEAEQ